MRRVVSWTESAVAVANQVPRRFVPGKGVRHLTCNPLGRRVARHAKANQSSSRVPKNDQAVEQLERDRSHYEKIKRSNAGSVVAQECLPTLGGRPGSPRHVLA